MLIQPEVRKPEPKLLVGLCEKCLLDLNIVAEKESKGLTKKNHQKFCEAVLILEYARYRPPALLHVGHEQLHRILHKFTCYCLIWVTNTRAIHSKWVDL